MVSEERLLSIDDELAQLGKSDEEVAAIASRYGGMDLAEVDRELDVLAADREGMDAIVALAREAVPSALSQTPEEPSEPDLDTLQGDPGLSELISAAEAGDPVSAPEEGAEVGEAPEGDGGLDVLMAELEAEEAAELEAEEDAAPPTSSPDLDAVLERAQAEAAPLGGLEAEDLFGGADPFGGEEAPAATGDLSDMFAAEELRAAAAEEPAPVALSETLEAEGLGGDERASLGTDEDEDDETYVFSMENVAGVQPEGAAPGAGSPMFDDDLDAMLAADIVGAGEPVAEAASAGEPVAEAASAGVVDEFELLVDEDIMLLEEDGIVEEVEKAESTDLMATDDPYAQSASIFDDESEPNVNFIDVASVVPEEKPEQGEAEGDEDEDEDAEKKGFFKKLFGKD